MRALLIAVSPEAARHFDQEDDDESPSNVPDVEAAVGAVGDGQGTPAAIEPWLVVLGDRLAPDALAAASERLDADPRLAGVPRLALVADDEAARAALAAGAIDVLCWPRDAASLPVRLEVLRRWRGRADGPARMATEAPDALLLIGADGRVVEVNRAAVDLLGYPRDDLCALRLPDLLVTLEGDGPGEPPLQIERLRAGEHVLTERRVRRRDGETLHLEIHSRLLPDGHVIAVAREVGPRLNRVRQLAISDRLSALGTFAAGMAHEINNPLSYVMADLEVLRDELDGLDGEIGPARREELRRLINEMTEGARRIADVVRDLRTFARADDAPAGSIDIHRLLSATLAIASSEIRRRARLERDLRPIPRVRANPARVGQVLVNLIVNALQSVPEGEPDRHVVRVATYTTPEGDAAIEVSDTGPGIAPELLQRIFDPFFSTKEYRSGGGLGLSVCHAIVSGLGGELLVESEPGHGSTFRVVLPAEERSTPPAPTPAPVTRTGAGARVLVIDDEPGVGRALRRILRRYETTIAVTGREARALLRDENFAVVFCDLALPDVDGLELYREVSARRPDLGRRFIFLTGGVLSKDQEATVAATGQPVVEKPFDLAGIRTLVERVAGEAAS